MNRRNFLSSSTLGAGALSLAPLSVFSNNNSISLPSIGSGFNEVYEQSTTISITSLSKGFNVIHSKLIHNLQQEGYIFDTKEVVKLSEHCLAIPLQKKPLIGFTTKEIALILNDNEKYQYHILDEKTTKEFNSLIYNYSKNISAHGLELDTIEFVAPVKVLKQSTGRESLFTYQNALNNKITIKSSSKRSATYIN
ncbi:hypothetical protein [Aquimarina sp. 2201CG5-10]|uniref:hypothetical protein n=1 Tax=Aquimarina callyspongiae TaxID=3098150 RepID=UPI002AB47CC1|nr:hypothetical protein [Aquimarina sp. 2201CG5-10]MDY8136796.1 hypothetical protein [Aquimarina sp. 2201CG5-10]